MLEGDAGAAGGVLRDVTAAGVPALYLGLGAGGVVLVLAMATRPGLRAFLAREPEPSAPGGVPA